ncbi:MurR/RpiR family transcriptional regulator [Enterococcus cecorum]|uniref:MurR/RpiR family transcriptional regulator n=1 Tax=Enterococcus cecorum TaxID=44008 RepID=UPI000B2BAC18|nr:MurR/RpiR family transcriptional regulator [Enterococcus cecorum]MCJ0595000.1 MurR/RpiR family transcriptional regulator [Enterococcus cecorum]MCJ0605532.1 MurR/RpiR family transcriptional regulator [Enterococcus cecorum]CAI3482936.1 MurR/RpiR family transcriptional regulator [Enterococcus cecorum]HLQ87356.1 MurR/RpiR family transcriptional regulator [Enterococcus sp.]
MSVQSRIHLLDNKLTDVEKRIAAYILAHPDEVINATAKEIGEQTQSSAPSVVRFIKKIGYSSVNEFKLSINSEKNEKRDQKYDDVNLADSFEVTKRKLCNNAILTLEETSEVLKQEQIKTIVHLLEEKEVLFVFGIGASSIIAEDIYQKWGRIGKIIFFEKDLHILTAMLSSHQANSAIWLVSNSGQTREVVKAAQIAKKIDIPIIAQTMLGKNPLSKLADHLIQTSIPKEAFLRSAATNSLFAQLLVVDTIFYNFLQNNEQYFEKIYNSRKLIEEINH